MHLNRAALATAAIVIMVFVFWPMAERTLAQTKEDPKMKIRHTLPTGWKKLTLSADQKTKVFAVMDDYRPKIKELEEQIKGLKADEHRAMVALLTDAQKQQLAKDLGLETPKVEPPPEKTK